MATSLAEDPVAIVGVSVPAVGLHIPDETPISLQIKAVQQAADDAGISVKDINGASMDWPGPGGSAQSGTANWGKLLGVTFNWVIDSGFDVHGIRALLSAAAAIKAGLCETVCISHALAGGPRLRGADRMIAIHDKGETHAQVAPRDDIRAMHEFSNPYGGGGMPHRAALSARRHMHDYGTTSEQIAEVSKTIRNFGHVNPEATLYGRGPYTIDDILASRMIADPLRLLDCSVVGQGGAALIVTSGQRARDLRSDPVYVLAGAMEIPRGTHADPARYADVASMGAQRIRRAFSQAGLTLDDVDVLSVYDATSFDVISGLEMLGFCKPGEGGPFVEGGALGLGGRIPTNTDGGLLSHGWAGGVQLNWKVIEAVRQLRGVCGPRQVEGAQVAVVTNSVPAAWHVEAVILGRGYGGFG